MNRPFSAIVGYALVTILLVPVATAGAQSPEADRPRIGLALGGGAARGIAHIGFLEWLEEHRIPIDRVVGTSMGGLVAGAYATGMSTKELREFMRTMDWDLAFIADSPFKYKEFRRKEDARAFPSQIELGLKGGLQLPSGLNPGQQVELALDRIGAPYDGMATFDDLPVPFRCVAVDLNTQQVVVLSSGSLARALRATMAIPGVFTPVAVGDQLFVDGGVLNNVPADVARSMGADVVIAVNVGSGTDEVPIPRNVFDVLSRTLDVMMSSGVSRALASADIVVEPDLGGVAGTDWRLSDELADRGYAAAESQRDVLLKHSVDDATYRAWQTAREARKSTTTPVISFVRVDGVRPGRSADVLSSFEAGIVGRPFDPADVSERVLRLTGTDRYSLVRYRLERLGADTGLEVSAEPKPYGPPFLRPAIDLENVDGDHVAMNLRGRVSFLDVGVPGVEMRVDLSAGTRPLAAVELYAPVGRSRVFIAPRAYWKRRSLSLFDGDRHYVAAYREREAGVGFDLGLALSSGSQLRVGYDVANLSSRLQIGLPVLPEASGQNQAVSAAWTYDSQNSPQIPTRGLYLSAVMNHYVKTPDLQFNDVSIPGPTGYNQGEVRGSFFHGTRHDHRLFLAAGAGTSFGREPGYNDFELGGLLALGAFSPGEVRGDGYALVNAGVLVHVGRLPDVLGGNTYIGGWLESGSVWTDTGAVPVEWQASAGIVLETIAGPVFIGGSGSLRSRAARFYLSVGPFFR